MKKFIRTMLGVTLLEVLLVLVIASLVLVMSIRYYQTATTQAKVNAAMEMVVGIIAAADTYFGSGKTTINTTDLAAYLPEGKAPNSPWGGNPVSISGTSASYTISFGTMPDDACSRLQASATSNPKITASGCPNLTLTVQP